MSELHDLLLLMFDIPTKTRKQQKTYRLFMKYIRGEGYIRFQDSIYIRVSSRNISADTECARLRRFAPSEARIQLLPLTVGMFERMRSVAGNSFDLREITESLIVL